jgi:hypothetical protein
MSCGRIRDFRGGKVGFVGMEFGAGILKILGFRKDLGANMFLQIF